MGRYGGVGMPRPKKKQPAVIENLRAAAAEVEQAAEAASSSSRAPERPPTAVDMQPVPAQ